MGECDALLLGERLGLDPELGLGLMLLLGLRLALGDCDALALLLGTVTHWPTTTG
jgi:hypothetical protein